MQSSKIRFGTDGWRAIMADAFTLANVRKVCRAIVRTVQRSGKAAQGLVIGRDTRFLGERFVAEAAAICCEANVPVWVFEDDAPTPLVAFAVVEHHLAGAIMFTASHNPPEYNGIKFIPEYGGPATAEITSAIEANLAQVTDAPAPEPAPDAVRTIRPNEAYQKHLLSLVDVDQIRSAGLRIAYDAMFGAGRRILPYVFEGAGLQVETFNGSRDPLFGGAMPDPNADRLQRLREYVVHQGIDIGLATDGDADRFGVVDSDGRFLSANEVLVLIAYHLLEHRGLRGSIVRTVATTHMLDRLAQAYGLECKETPVGFKHICEEMRQNQVLIGGEESGGLSVLGHIPEKDGVLANLLVTELRAFAGRPLRDVWQDIVAKVGTAVNRRIDMHVPDAAKQQILAEMKDRPPQDIDGYAVEDVSTADGVKYRLSGDRWLLLRASGTEPLMRLYVEAPDQAGMEALANWAMQRIEAMS